MYFLQIAPAITPFTNSMKKNYERMFSDGMICRSELHEPNEFSVFCRKGARIGLRMGVAVNQQNAEQQQNDHSHKLTLTVMTG